MKPGDGYPERICNPCRMQLGMFYYFKIAAIRMDEIYTKTLNESNALERNREAINSMATEKSPPTKPKSVRKSPRMKPITNREQILFHEPFADSPPLIIEPCYSVKMDTERLEPYSPTGTYNSLEDDENEIEITFSEEQQNLAEDVVSKNVSYEKVKKESIEMDEIYLEDEFHEPAFHKEDEEEENDDISEDIPKEYDESIKVNSEEQSNDGNDTVSKTKIKCILGKGHLFRLVHILSSLNGCNKFSPGAGAVTAQ